MPKLMTNHEIISDKAKNPVTSTDYIKHGDKWLGTALTEVETALNSKADKSYVDAELSNELNKKVDKVSGKGLSTNDYSDEEKAKVNNATEELIKFNGYFTLV